MSSSNSLPLTYRLLARGAYVAIEQGKLIITAANDGNIPPEWLQENKEKIFAEIAEKLSINALTYLSYSTGKYTLERYGGVTLQFFNLRINSDAFCTFNAHLDRANTTQHGEEGSPLPKRQFRVGKRSSLQKLWRSTGLPIPKDNSSYHCRMGRLKEVVLTGEVATKGKIKKTTLKPLTVSFYALKEAYLATELTGNSRGNHEEIAGKSLESMAGEIHGDASRGTVAGNDSPQSHTTQAIQPNPTTGKTNYGSNQLRGHETTVPTNYGQRLIGNEVIRTDTSHFKTTNTPAEQSNDDWLKEFADQV